MSYQEKRTLVSIGMGLIVLFAYGLYVMSRYQNGSLLEDDLPTWASLMLIFIGIGIAATIVTQIVFHVLYSIAIAIREKAINPDINNEVLEKIIKQTMVTDEMDKLVELKSMRIGFIVAGVGFIVGLILVLLGYSAMVMMNTLFIAFCVGSIGEGFMQIFYYRRGIKHG